MSENYIDIVRKSLYHAPKKSSLSKNVFHQENLEKYKSENVFESISYESSNLNRNKTQQSVFHKKIDKNKKNDNFRERKKLISKHKINKKQHTLELTTKTNNKPSKSEIDIPRLFGKNESSDQSEVESDDFDVDIFFNTRDNSFNESITEAHSGIDYEFVSDCNKSVKITGTQFTNINHSTHIINKSNLVEINSLKNATTPIIANEKEQCNEVHRVTEIFSCSDNENKKINKHETKHTRKIIKPKETIKVSNQIQELPSCSLTCKNDKYKRKSKINKTSENFNDSQDYLLQTEECILNDQMRNLLYDKDEENRSNNSFEMTTDTNNKTEDTCHIRTMLQPIILEINDDDSETPAKIIVLKEHMSIPFYGMFALQVLHGQVEVLGAILDQSSTISKLFSPRGSALLSIKNITNESSTSLKKLLPDANIEDIFIDTKTAVIKSSTVVDKYILFVEKYISQQIFPKFGTKGPHVTFQTKEDWNVIKINELWNEIIDIITPSTKLLIAGGKGVGKSTFLRYAINRLLMKYEEIRVIDLDPGQSEFFVPGCISIFSIKTPIFGPNYTHLMHPDRSFLSEINIGQNPSAYINSIASLMEYVSGLENVPTLINYMGFSKGIGLKIISSAISYIQPTDIVQINSKNRQKNFTQDLSLNVVKENCDFFGGKCSNLYFSLHIIPSVSDQKAGGWSLEPRQVREMCVLAYLGQMMKENTTTLTDHTLPMYKINLCAIKLINLEKIEISPASVNANLVALCALEDSNNFLCYGYGVVRGIDLENGQLVLITPESIETLEKVYYLVLGNVSLPPSVYMLPENVSGQIPYVMEGELEFLGQIIKRTYLPATTRR